MLQSMPILAGLAHLDGENAAAVVDTKKTNPKLDEICLNNRSSDNEN